MSLTFAIDWDRTYSEDTEFFDMMVQELKDRGHRALIVTGRPKRGGRAPRDNNLLIQKGRELDIPVVFCNFQPKREVVKEYGYEVDGMIWIDDLPELI